MSSAEELVESVLSGFASDQNPYSALRAALHSQMYSEPNKVFGIQIWILTGLLGVVLLESILALSVRYYLGTTWVYKLQRTTNGTFILPNASVVFLILTCCFVIVFFPYVYYGNRFMHGSGSLINLSLWKSYIFIPCWIAAWHSAWSTALSGSLRQPSSESNTSRGPFLPAWLLNGYFLTFVVLVPATVLPLYGVANAHFNKGFNLYLELDAGLKLLELTWISGPPIGLGAASLKLAQNLMNETTTCVHWFKLGWIVWAVWGGLVVATLLPATALYMKTRQRKISELRSINTPSRASAGIEVNRGFQGNKRVESTSSSALSDAFISLCLTSMSLCAVVIIYTGVAAWSASIRRGCCVHRPVLDYPTCSRSTLWLPWLELP